MKKKFSIKLYMSACYLILVLAILGIYSLKTFSISKQAISDVTYKDTQEMLETKIEMLDVHFSNIQEASLQLLVDEALYKLFDELDWHNTAELLTANREVNEILKKYFESYTQISYVYLVTEEYLFGYSNSEGGQCDNFKESSLYQQVIEMEGNACYAPMPNNYFALTRLANLTKATSRGKLYTLEEEHIPVLVVGFQETVFRKEIQKILPEQEASYMVLTQDGTIVSNSEKGKTGTKCESELLELIQDQSGEIVKLNGENYIICQAISEVTGWKTVTMISTDVLTKDMVEQVSKNLLFFLIISLLAGIAGLSLVTNQLTKVIRRLVLAVERMGTGTFDGKIEDSNISEFHYLVSHFDSMRRKLKHLIEENYVMKINQQEIEISILNTQLNPHFLQNTLNVIQLSNLNGNQNETGKMIIALSRMLHYTADNREEFKILRDEVEWLKQYIYIMECRYGSELQIECQIDEALMNRQVPKLFLQPIIENSILHAFQEKETDCRILIAGKSEAGRMVFTVSDNGDGMDEAKIQHFFDENTDSIGIKNVYKRLQLIYQRSDLFEVESMIGKGTRTTIMIPDES